ncbi:hypothetical protein [Nocardia salmonicida]|uniref:hypothetical protein n=1 Tax=Nocardia salmonicida TaxID=53431 RepID=UPI0033CB9573
MYTRKSAARLQAITENPARDTAPLRSGQHTGTHRTRAAVAFATAAAVALGGAAGIAAAAEQQPGVTGPSEQQPGVTPRPQTEQPGVTPTPTPPAKPPQSPLGAVIPDPPSYAPEEYRSEPTTPPQRQAPAPQQQAPAPQQTPAPQQQAPAPQQTPAPRQNGPYYSGPGADDGQYSTPQTPSAPAPSLAQDLPNLHAPTPLPEKPKIIMPPDPTKLGLGQTTIDRPDWVPADVAWEINGHIAVAQRDTNAFLQSTGLNPSRSDAMAAAMVLGGVTGFTIGAVTAGVPMAVIGGVGGGLIGGTVGGIAGAAVGTFIPIPVIGTVTSGVAGTAAGAAAGAAIGAAALGIPAALAGGAVGATVGVVAGAVATGGDGSDFTPRPAVPVEPQEVVPAPTLHDQFAAQADAAVESTEQAVEWVEAQPGGEQATEWAVDLGTNTAVAIESQPWAQQAGETLNQTAHDVVDAAQNNPDTAPIVDALVEVIGEQEPFAPGQFGAFTDVANQALGVVQGVVQ